MRKVINLLKKNKDILIFIMGLAMVCYPIISNHIESSEQESLIKTYESAVNELDDDDKYLEIEKAEKWNEALYTKQSGLPYGEDLGDYSDILSIGEEGLIGSIQIPSISVNMPIYHGTDDKVLSVGAGHLEDTSLPVGGTNTHCVLTGHRGLPSSELFTRLDELQEGDLFFINVLDRTLTYQIDSIQVVYPEILDQNGFPIVLGEDRVTLMTCTPYGINTQRLLVSGHRVADEEINDVQQTIDAIKKKIPSKREIIFYIIPVVFIILGIVMLVKGRWKKDA